MKLLALQISERHIEPGVSFCSLPEKSLYLFGKSSKDELRNCNLKGHRRHHADIRYFLSTARYKPKDPFIVLSEIMNETLILVSVAARLTHQERYPPIFQPCPDSPNQISQVALSTF
jgi:hypothetical protein